MPREEAGTTRPVRRLFPEKLEIFGLLGYYTGVIRDEEVEWRFQVSLHLELPSTPDGVKTLPRLDAVFLLSSVVASKKPPPPSLCHYSLVIRTFYFVISPLYFVLCTLYFVLSITICGSGMGRRRWRGRGGSRGGRNRASGGSAACRRPFRGSRPRHDGRRRGWR